MANANDKPCDKRHGETPERMKGRAALFLAGLCALTLAVCLVVSWRLWQIGPDQWVWPYFPRPGGVCDALPAIALGAALCLVLLFCLRKGLQRTSEELAALVICMALAFGMVHYIGKASLVGEYESVLVTAAPSKGGYYAEAVRVQDMPEYLATYAETIRGLKVSYRVRGHIADHPAQPIVFHWLVNRTMESAPALARFFCPEEPQPPAQVWRSEARSTATPALPKRLDAKGMEDLTLYQLAQYLVSQRDKEISPQGGGETKYVVEMTEKPVPLSYGAFAGIWAAAFVFRMAFWLSLIPVYLLGHELFSKECGLIALCLAALIPSLHLFGPYIDQTFPCFTLWAFYAWRRAVCKKSWLWAAVSGGILLAGMLWSLSLLLAVGLIGVATLLTLWKEVADKENPVSWIGWGYVAMGGFGGFVILSLLPMALFHYDTWSVWKICLSQHATFARLFSRSYLTWLLYNPVDFLLFTGVPIAVLLMMETIATWRQWWPQWRRSSLPLLPWALVGLLAVANLSGKNLGEVARLWMFLMPFAALSAAPALLRIDQRRGWMAAGVVGLAGLQLVVFRLCLDVSYLANQ